MKKLLLIRHAKSDWAHQVSDFDRPLNARGHQAAPEMAQRLLEKNIIPELLLHSPAQRTTQTAAYFTEKWTLKNVQSIRHIYEANITALLQIINTQSDDYESIAIVGHNPGITDVINYLSTESLYNVPTCGVALLQFETQHWNEISMHSGKLIHYDFPKNGDD